MAKRKNVNKAVVAYAATDPKYRKTLLDAIDRRLGDLNVKPRESAQPLSSVSDTAPNYNGAGVLSWVESVQDDDEKGVDLLQRVRATCLASMRKK